LRDEGEYGASVTRWQTTTPSTLLLSPDISRPRDDIYHEHQKAWEKLVVVEIGKNGAAYVTRTRDPVITNDVLYQLS
jgi:hypothetical protein